MITTVKYQADIETPTTYIGYLVDGTKNVPIDSSNRDYQKVQVWISEGNIPVLAYTQAELDKYAHDQVHQDILNAINNIIVWYQPAMATRVHEFSGSFDAQNIISTSILKLEPHTGTKTLIFFTKEKIKVPVNRADLLDLLELISVEQEKITNN